VVVVVVVVSLVSVEVVVVLVEVVLGVGVVEVVEVAVERGEGRRRQMLRVRPSKHNGKSRISREWGTTIEKRGRPKSSPRACFNNLMIIQ
jgi:hypothetical protein